MSDYTPTTEEVVLPPLNEEVIKGLALLGLDQMVGVDDERAKQFEDAFDQWLFEHDRQVSERVWEEGAKAEAFVIATSRDSFPTEVTAFNPYRQGEEQ